MIQKTRQLLGLKNFVNTIEFIDESENADYTFQVYDFPSRFYLGKNSFKILANPDFLETGSPILIDIEDSAGNPIYHEVTSLINRDRSRTVAVNIYPDTVIGYATVYLASKLDKNPLTGETISSDSAGINVIWKKKVLVSTSERSAHPIIFSKSPTVVYENKPVPRQISNSTASRYTELENRALGKVSIDSRVNPSNTSAFLEDIDLDYESIDSVPEIYGNRGVNRGPTRIPKYSSLGVLSFSNFPISESMENGRLVVRNIGLTGSSGQYYTAPDFSCSIIRVVNKNQAEIHPPFNYSVSEGSSILSFNGFKNQTNFTASYFFSQNMASDVTQSFLRLEFYDLEPTLGEIDSIRVRYKEAGAYGSLRDLGTYRLNPQNIFTDSSSVSVTQDGLQERRLGWLEPNEDLSALWTVSANGVSGLSTEYSDVFVRNSIRIIHDSIPSSSRYVKLEANGRMRLNAAKNTGYELSFYAAPGKIQETISRTPQLDIYISGSSVRSTPRASKTTLPVLQDVENLGHYIGSIESGVSSSKFVKFEFEVLDQKAVTPIFLTRAGEWDIGQIAISPISSTGYNANHARIFVPLSGLDSDAEPIFEIEYTDRTGNRADLSQKLSGIRITGNESSATVQNIFGSNVSFREVGSGSVPMNRLSIGNPGQFNLYYSSSIGESSIISYITQSSFVADGFGGTIVSIPFPIFRDNIDNSLYTAGSASSAVSYTIETVIYGKTGSFGSLKDTNVWASSVQGRAIISDFDNSGQPLLFNVVSLSGSGGNIFGTYGSGSVNPKKNLDSWYSINSVVSNPDSIVVRHSMIPSSSFQWNFYATSACIVKKIDIRF